MRNLIIILLVLTSACHKETYPVKDVRLDAHIVSYGKISILQSNLVVDNYIKIKYSIKNTSQYDNVCEYYKINFAYEPTSGGFVQYQNDYNYCYLLKDSITYDSLLIKIPSLNEDYYVKIVAYEAQ